MAVPESKTPETTSIELYCAQSPSSRSNTQFSLPRCLARPAFRPITPETIAAVDPVLAGIPLGYILNMLKEEIGPRWEINLLFFAICCPRSSLPPCFFFHSRLHEATRATQAILPDGPLPNELLVQFDTSLEPPTHVLAIRSKQNRNMVTLYPCHALIMSTGCAHLPLLPFSPAVPPENAEPQFTLPVVYLSLPSPETFRPILNFLYMRHTSVIFEELLPIEDSPTEPVIEWSKRQAHKYSREELLTNAQKIWGLWANASALGIFDDQLFTALEFAWEVGINALDLIFNGSTDPKQAGPAS